MIWKGMKLLLIVLLLPFVMAGQAGAVDEAAPVRAMPKGDATRGKVVFEKRCAWCHGWDGAGEGPAVDVVRPKPRDFTRAKYRIRTTTGGKLPTDRNLFDAISNGLPGTSMPAWKGLISDQEISDVTQYLKTLSKKFARWKKKGRELPEVTVGPEIPSSPESIEKGKELYTKLGCWKCHGKSGRASGPSMSGLIDERNVPIRPANFHKPWNFRGGSSRKDIYLRFNTGVNGTPMPSFQDQLDNEKSWHLANFVRSLGPEKRPQVRETIYTEFIEGDIPMDFEDPKWHGNDKKKVVSYYFPLLGQIMIEPRRFWPNVDDIYIKALHNGKDVAFLIEWDDPTKSPIAPNKVYPLQYADGFDLQLPLLRPEDPTKKPYFVGGDKKRKMGIWSWNSESEKAVLLKGKGIYKRKVVEGATPIETKSVYNDGRWSLLMKRAMKTDNDKELQIEAGKFLPISFQALDGSEGDTGSLRSVSTWYWLILKPNIPPTRYAAAAVAFILTLGLEFVWMRRQNNA